MAERYWIETLGCPKNRVDSDKLAGTLVADGLEPATAPDHADLVVVNTCAFVEAAREESIEAILALSEARRSGTRLVVTGCMAERYRHELAEALPEIDLVAPFGSPLVPRVPFLPEPARVNTPLVPTGNPLAGTGIPAHGAPTGATPVAFGPKSARGDQPADRIGAPSFDLLELKRPPAEAPWSYVKVAEGCDRSCGFCAIPSFRGRQRSRSTESILDEIEQLDAAEGTLREVVLVAQDLASFGLDRSVEGRGRGRGRAGGPRPIVELVSAVSARVPWTRLLYLYPSSLDDGLVDAILGTGVPYFDLSLQHVSRPLLKRMRRWGEGERFLDRIAAIRASAPDAAFRSSFIIGYPGETEADHDLLLEWIDEARLDWVGFFPFSNEDGTPAARLDGQVPARLVAERLRECSERQDAVTAQRRDELIGATVEVLVDAPGEGRTYREAPEIDGVVTVPAGIPVGSFVAAVVTGADGPDMVADPIGGPSSPVRARSAAPTAEVDVP